MGKVTVVIGTQFGDESKGGVIYHLVPNADWYVRFNGGNNAGHEVEGKKLHYLPAGILMGKKVGLAGGMVIHPPALFDELDKNNLSRDLIKNVSISDKTKVTLPSHYFLDGLYSIIQGDMAAKSTYKGIAPTYSDKTARFGISFADLLEVDTLEKKMQQVLDYHRKIFFVYERHLVKVKDELTSKFGEKGKEMFEDSLHKDSKLLAKEYHEIGQQLRSNIVDLSLILTKAYFENGQSIAFEGAQGFALSVDQGIYPFGTSSDMFAIEENAGFPLGVVDRAHKSIVGVVKLPMSRVGGGPKPTKIGGELEDLLREKGREYGTTTGRPRDVCWPCEVMVRNAIRICGITDIAIVKTDVFGGMKEPIKVNTHYTHDELIFKDSLPTSMKVFADMKTNYREEEPWSEHTQEEWIDAVKGGIFGLADNHQTFLANFAKNVNMYHFLDDGNVTVSVGPSSKAKFMLPYNELVKYATI